MKAEQFTEWLKKHNACEDAIEWQEGKDLTIVWQTCHRGDWMLWLAKRAGVEKRLLVLTAAHCANTVRHLMKDERSRNAVDVAIRYGEGKATVEELQVAAYAAYAAYAYAADAAAAAAAYAYAADAAAAAYYAAYAAAYAYAADAAAAAYYAAYAAAYADAAAAKQKNRQETADICKKHISYELIESLIKQQHETDRNS